MQYVRRELQSLRGLLKDPRQVSRALPLARRGRARAQRGPPPPLPQLAFQVLNLAMIVMSALMIWRSLMVLTGSESPVVVVLR